MIPALHVKVEFSRPPRTLVRDFKAAMAEAYKEAGLHWHQKMLPRHFDSGATMRYGYTPRTAGYIKRKRRVKGHATPLVWSGQLKQAALLSARIKSTHNMAQVRFGSGARALNFSGTTVIQNGREITVSMRAARRGVKRRQNYPDMRREMTAVTESEQTELARLIERRAAFHLRRLRRLSRQGA